MIHDDIQRERHGEHEKAGRDPFADMAEMLAATSDRLGCIAGNKLIARLAHENLGAFLSGESVDHVIATIRLLERNDRLPHREPGATLPPGVPIEQVAHYGQPQAGYLDQLREQGIDVPPMPPTASGFPPAAPQFTPVPRLAPSSEQDGQAQQ